MKFHKEESWIAKVNFFCNKITSPKVSTST